MSQHEGPNDNTGNPLGGTRTAEGKARSSLNALKHGLSGRHTVIPEGMQDQYDRLVQGLRHERAPLGAVEGSKFDLLLHFRWNLYLIGCYEHDLLARGNPLHDPELRAAVQLLIRWQRHNLTAYRHVFADVCAQQNTRLSVQGLGHTLSTAPLPVTADTRRLHAATVQAMAANSGNYWTPPGPPAAPPRRNPNPSSSPPSSSGPSSGSPGSPSGSSSGPPGR